MHLSVTSMLVLLPLFPHQHLAAPPPPPAGGASFPGSLLGGVLFLEIVGPSAASGPREGGGGEDAVGQPACQVLGWRPQGAMGRSRRKGSIGYLEAPPWPRPWGVALPAGTHSVLVNFILSCALLPCCHSLSLPAHPSELLDQDLSLAAHRLPGRPPQPQTYRSIRSEHQFQRAPSQPEDPAFTPPHNRCVPGPCPAYPPGEPSELLCKLDAVGSCRETW